MGTGKSLTAPERVRRLQAALHAKNGRRHDLIREPDAEDPHVGSMSGDWKRSYGVE